MAEPVDYDFVRALPKAELHAHLTGSISKDCLHDIWLSKQAIGKCANLEDPLTALQPNGGHPDIISFFPLFDTYMYQLVNDVESVKHATERVVNDFAADGVAYLELRTTPRENAETGLTREEYVRAVLDTMLASSTASYSKSANRIASIEVMLILSIDRRMTPCQAMDVVKLASHFGERGTWRQSLESPQLAPYVVGIDLCGNPTKGDVSQLTEAFNEARRSCLKITVHLAEVPSQAQMRNLTCCYHGSRTDSVMSYMRLLESAK